MDSCRDIGEIVFVILIVTGFATVLILAIKLIAYLYEITIGKVISKMLNRRFAKKVTSCTCQECHCAKNRDVDNDIKYTV